MRLGKWVLGLAVVGLMLSATAARGEFVHFTQIGTPDYDLANLISMTVTPGPVTDGSNTAVVSISWVDAAYANQLSSYAPGIITEVYVQDGSLYQLLNPSGDDVEYYKNYTKKNGGWAIAPGDLPGGNSLNPQFTATQGFTSQAGGSDKLDISEGVAQQGDMLVLTFKLDLGVDYTQTIADLNPAPSPVGDWEQLRFGLHVQAIGTGASASFVSTGADNTAPGPTPSVPLPAAAWSGMALMCAFMAVRTIRRRMA